MVNEVVYFIVPIIGIVIFALGLSYEDYVLIMFGGIVLLIFGTTTFIYPIPVLESVQNDVLASVCFGIGAYIGIRASVEKIQQVVG